METLEFYLLFNTNFMVHTIITLLLTLVFAGYLLYLSLIKKDWKTFYPTLELGLFFLAAWSLLYYLFF